MHEIDDEDRSWRRLGDVVTVLCGQVGDGLSGKRRERVRRATADLRRCIEQRAAPMLTEDERVLADLEQAFGQSEPIGRVAGADLLIPVLRHFVEEPEWRGLDDEDRRVRARLARDLAQLAVSLPELRSLDPACALRDLRGALRRARQQLRRDQQERRMAQMDPVLRAQIEQQIAAAGLSRRRTHEGR